MRELFLQWNDFPLDFPGKYTPPPGITPFSQNTCSADLHNASKNIPGNMEKKMMKNDAGKFLDFGTTTGVGKFKKKKMENDESVTNFVGIFNSNISLFFGDFSHGKIVSMTPPLVRKKDDSPPALWPTSWNLNEPILQPKNTTKSTDFHWKEKNTDKSRKKEFYDDFWDTPWILENYGNSSEFSWNAQRDLAEKSPFSYEEPIYENSPTLAQTRAKNIILSPFSASSGPPLVSPTGDLFPIKKVSFYPKNSMSPLNSFFTRNWKKMRYCGIFFGFSAFSFSSAFLDRIIGNFAWISQLDNYPPPQRPNCCKNHWEKSIRFDKKTLEK